MSADGPKTIRVRIAVAVSPDALDCMPSTSTVVFVEADIPLPVTIDGEVRP